MEEYHIIPQSYYELGMIYRKRADYRTAKSFIEKTLEYKGYLTETIISYRAKFALELIDAEQITTA